MLKFLLSAGAACVVLAVAVVAGATPTANPKASIAGTPKVDAVLTLTQGQYTPEQGGTLAAPTDAWQRCDDVGSTTNCVPVGNGGLTYTVGAADLDKYISVTESVSDGVGDPYLFTTGSIGPIVPAPPPPQAPQLVTAPSISPSGANLNVGQGLKRAAGAWSGNPTPDVTVAWQRCNNAAGSGCVDVGSSAIDYTLAAADMGKFMRVRETATNGVGSDPPPAYSNALGPVTQPLAAGNPPTISPTAPLVNDTITVTSPGTWTGFPQPTPALYTYLWQRCNDASGGGCVDAGTASTYPVGAADAGKWIRVKVTASNGSTQAQSVWVQTAQAVQQAPVNTVAPAITPSNANLLFTVGGPAVTIGVSNNGTWTAAPAVTSYAYEWQRCTSTDVATCAVIAGAPTTTPYTVQQADVGSFVRVKVTATNGVNPAGIAYSPLTATQVRQSPPYQGATDAATPRPSIVDPNNDGKPGVGETLQGLAGTWFAFPAPTLTPQWFRCNTAGVNCVAVSPAPSYTPGVTTGPEPYRHTNPAGSWPYVVTDADLGSTLKLVAGASNSLGTTVSRESLVTAVVQAGPVNLSAVPNGLAALTGTAARGQTLTVTSGLWTGFSAQGSSPLAITHEWQHCPTDGNLTGCVPVSADPPLSVRLSPAGATTCSSAAPCGGTSQYALTDADLGSRLRVVVRVSNSIATVTLATGLTDVVVGSPIIPVADGNPDPAAQPMVTGSAAQGLTLVASTGSWSAYPAGDALTYTYQWLRCSGGTIDSCSAVNGATTGYYLVGAADVGAQIRVRVTATNGVLPNGVADSAPTAKVTGSNGGGGPGADLIVQLNTSTSGNTVTYKVTVRNIGSSDADGVVLNATIGDSLQLVSATSTKGTCSGRVTCAIGQVKSGESVTVSIAITSSSSGTFSFTATVSSTTTDVNPSNNSVSTGSRLTTVSPVPSTGDGGVTAGVGPGPASTQLTVPISDVALHARRVGKTWVAATTFTLYSGKANLKLVVTQNGSTKPLTLAKGSRLGTVTTKANAQQITMAATKSATFPVKVVLPATGLLAQGRLRDPHHCHRLGRLLHPEHRLQGSCARHQDDSGQDRREDVDHGRDAPARDGEGHGAPLLGHRVR